MRQIAIALVLIALPSVAIAQDLAPLNELKACRVDASTVSLAFIYDGGACERTGDATVAMIEGDSAVVSVPTTSTAEVCTMQMVRVNFAGLIEVPEAITSLDVQVLSPGGEVVAGAKSEITPHAPDCLPPEAQAPVAE